MSRGPEPPARLTRPRRDELDEPGRAVYDAITTGPRATAGRASPIVDDGGRLLGPFNAMVVAPAVGQALQALGSALRYGTSLRVVDRELAILVVAARHRYEFEWSAHVGLAHAAGLSEADTDELAAGRRPAGIDAGGALVLVVVQQLLERRDLDDTAYARAVAALGETGLVELVTLVGYYELLGLSMTTFRVGLPDGVAPRWRR